MTFNQVVGGSRPPTLIPIEYFALGLEAIVEIEHSGLARFFDSRYREIMVFFLYMINLVVKKDRQ